MRSLTSGSLISRVGACTSLAMVCSSRTAPPSINLCSVGPAVEALRRFWPSLDGALRLPAPAIATMANSLAAVLARNQGSNIQERMRCESCRGDSHGLRCSNWRRDALTLNRSSDPLGLDPKIGRYAMDAQGSAEPTALGGFNDVQDEVTAMDMLVLWEERDEVAAPSRAGRSRRFCRTRDL